jgi:hypothetical protein
MFAARRSFKDGHHKDGREPMQPTEIFDICYVQYRSLRAWLGRKTRAVDPKRPSSGYLWRPERARAAEYIADFERIGERALRKPEWEGRRKLFRIHFVRRLEHRRARALVGVSEGTWDYWYREVKKTVGRACARSGIFPPGRYFRHRGGRRSL